MDRALRRNRAFLTFLGELRAGADVRSAAVVAEIGEAAANVYAAAERRGEYTDVVAIEPNWRFVGGSIQFRVSQ